MKMHPEATSPSTRNPDGGSKQDDSESMKTLGCTRQDIWRCLRRRVPDELLFRKKVSEVVSITGEDGKTRNIVHFKDGSPPAEADLVIGADGVKSTVRKALFPDKKDAYPPQYEYVRPIPSVMRYFLISEDDANPNEQRASRYRRLPPHLDIYKAKHPHRQRNDDILLRTQWILRILPD